MVTLILFLLSRPLIEVGGRLHLIAPDIQVQIHSLYSWTGTGNRIELYETPYGLHMFAHIDVKGPTWLLVEMRQSSSGIIVQLDQTGTGFSETKWWPSWQALRDDRSFDAQLVVDLIREARKS